MKASLESRIEIAREAVIRRRTEHDVLKAQKDVMEKNASALRVISQGLSDGVLLVQKFGSGIQTDVISRFEDLINRGIRQIFKRDYVVDIEFQAKANSFYADFYVTLPNGRRINLEHGEGGGLKHLAAILKRVLYLVLEPSQPAKILFFDENLKDLDVWRYTDGFKFIMGIARELGIQIIWVTHNQDICSGDFDIEDTKVLQFNLEDECTVVKKL
jgi:hypothetical protein